MKGLNIDELLSLVNKQIDNMTLHIICQGVVTNIGLIQSLLLLFGLIGFIYFIPIYVVCTILYFYHNSKYKKSDKLIKEIFEEIDSRES
jgi:hypothetical protein